MKVEFTDEQRRGKVVAGVDTHDRMHVLCVLSEHGSVLRTGEFPATEAGYDELAAAIGEPGGCLAVGVEGASSYGAGLARRLGELGYLVLEVLRPRRARRRGRAKNDALDAERAARDVWSCERSLSTPKDQGGWVGRLRFLSKSRDSLVKSCTQLSNAAQSLVKTAPEDVRGRYRGMRSHALMPLLARGGGDPAEPVMSALSALGRAWVAAREGADALEAQMEAALRANCPALLAMDGLGAVGAARIAVAVGGNPGRIGSEAQLAALFGTSPVEASTGGAVRHRLNRGGDRQANSAIHQVAVARAKGDPATRAYIERRCGAAAGKGKKSKKEAYRCLQRYIVREVYQAITHPFDVPAWADVSGLREARVAAGVTQAQAAAALGTSAQLLSKVENGKRRPKAIIARYREWVDAGLPVDVSE